MALSYHIDTSLRLVFSRAEATIRDADLLAHQDRLRSDPAFDPSFDQLFDYSQVEEMDITEATVRLLAARNPFMASVRRAFVVVSEPARQLTAQFLAAGGLRPEDSRIFNSVAEARRWLHLK